jgi:predicted metal-dependent phosphoesterase TrpH
MIRITSGILVIVGLIGGTFSDRAPDTPAVRRGGYNVIEADFHVHSFLGDGMLSPFALVSRARRKGLHAFAITDHNAIFGAKAGRWYSRLIGGPTVLVGEEITAPGFHVIAVGIDEHVTSRQSAAEVIDDIHRQSGVAIAAHPTRRYWAAFDDVVRQLDGAEVMHTNAYASNQKGEEIISFYRRAEENDHRLTAVGSSDYHWFNSLGICRTYVFVRSNDEADILEALRAGRTVVFDRERNAYGDPELIRLLQDQPIRLDVGDYHYRGSGVVDVVTRSAGWLGLIGLVLFGRKRPLSSEKFSA